MQHTAAAKEVSSAPAPIGGNKIHVVLCVTIVNKSADVGPFPPERTKSNILRCYSLI